MNILIVCTGNTCRSPMAQGIVADIITKHNKQEDFTVVSCGISAFDGESASENAILSLKEIGIDISSHGSQRTTLELLDLADIIYVMTPAHQEMITLSFPEIADKINVLNVSDPFGGTLDDYNACRDQILAYFEQEVPKLIAVADSTTGTTDDTK